VFQRIQEVLRAHVGQLRDVQGKSRGASASDHGAQAVHQRRMFSFGWKFSIAIEIASNLLFYCSGDARLGC